MKSKVILFAIALFSLVSCGGNANKQHGTHVHEDGSVHADHGTEQVAPTKQESFKVDADTTATKEADHHDHNHDHGHTHADGTHHTH